MASARELSIEVDGGSVSALYRRPRGAVALFVLAHGAGAGMRHPFLETMTAVLAERRIATLRYQFPYMEARDRGGRPPPNRAPILEATVRAATARARKLARGLPLVAGGKSMGGRMTSQAAAGGPLPGVDGIAFLGFPLHPAGRPEKAAERSAHLERVGVPMLFVQGTRDKLAPLRPMRRVVRRLGANATLHVVRGADHGFAVLVRSGRRSAEVFDEIGSAIDGWARSVL